MTTTTAPMPDSGIEMALRLRRACEAHDNSIAEHLDRVTRYACVIGRRAGLTERELIDLEYATPLHDMGKIGIPLQLLQKPGRLTPPEMEMVKAHTLIGHRILAESNWSVIRCAAVIALSHHECWNGGGYPHRLCGTQIPLEARIVAVADVYDALLSQRAYKPAWAEERVVAEMREMRGTRFDPEILDLFMGHLPQLSTSSSTAAPH